MIKIKRNNQANQRVKRETYKDRPVEAAELNDVKYWAILPTQFLLNQLVKINSITVDFKFNGPRGKNTEH